MGSSVHAALRACAGRDAASQEPHAESTACTIALRESRRMYWMRPKVAPVLLSITVPKGHISNLPRLIEKPSSDGSGCALETWDLVDADFMSE